MEDMRGEKKRDLPECSLAFLFGVRARSKNSFGTAQERNGESLGDYYSKYSRDINLPGENEL